MNIDPKTIDLDLGPAEDASAELYTAEVFVSAADAFVIEVRGWLKHSSIDDAKKSLADLDTMLVEIRDKIRLAKAKVDAVVDDTYAKCRAVQAS